MRELQGMIGSQNTGAAIGADMAGLMGFGGSFSDIIMQAMTKSADNEENEEVKTNSAVLEYANMLNFFMPDFSQNDPTAVKSEEALPDVSVDAVQTVETMSKKAEIETLAVNHFVNADPKLTADVFVGIGNAVSGETVSFFDIVNSMGTVSNAPVRRMEIPDEETVNAMLQNAAIPARSEMVRTINNKVSLNVDTAVDKADKTVEDMEISGSVKNSESEIVRVYAQSDIPEKTAVVEAKAETKQPERSVKLEPVEKSEVPERTAVVETKVETKQPERAVKFETIEKSEMPEKTTVAETKAETKQPERAVKLETVEKSEMTEKTAVVETKAETKQSERAVKLETVEKSEMPEKTAVVETKAETKQSERAMKLESVEKSEILEKTAVVGTKVETKQPERAVKLEPVEKSEMPEKAAVVEAKAETKQPERAVKLEPVEKSEMLEKAVVVETKVETKQPERAVKLEPVEKSEMPEKAAAVETKAETKQPERAVKLEPVEKSEMLEKAAVVEAKAETKQPERAVKLEPVEKSEMPEKAAVETKVETKQPERAVKLETVERSEMPEKTAVVETKQPERAVLRNSVKDLDSSVRTFSEKISENVKSDTAVYSVSEKGGNEGEYAESSSYESKGFGFEKSAGETTVKNLSDNEKTKEQTDIEALQSHADSFDVRRSMISAIAAKKSESVMPPSKQLLESVEKNISKGINEFTVKLRPQGIGEIVVKLVMEDGGKMLMSMTASSAKTAELLNRDLAMLQSSLDQHNVEIVDKAQTETVVPMNSVFEQYYGEGHEQNGHGQYSPQKNRFARSFSGIESFDDEIAEEEVKIASGLDIKV